MITDHLDKYYAAFGRHTLYTVLRSIVIDGHEVAWVEFKGVRDDQTSYAGRGVRCECDFTEDVGWKVSKDGPVRVSYNCIRRQAALYLRHLELREEFALQIEQEYPDDFIEQQMANRILDLVFWLVKKVEANEWVEDGNGAWFWGGYVYLQTVAAVGDFPMSFLRAQLEDAIAAKVIQLEGSVIQVPVNASSA